MFQKTMRINYLTNVDVSENLSYCQSASDLLFLCLSYCIEMIFIAEWSVLCLIKEMSLENNEGSTLLPLQQNWMKEF